MTDSPAPHPDDATAAARALLNSANMARWLAPTAESRIERISIRSIEDRDWPPDDADAEAVGSLHQSVASHGIVEPLLLRPREGNRFQLVTGSRRLRVARALGLATVPAIVRDLDDTAMLVATLWSVSGRQRLSPEQTGAMQTRLVAAGMSAAEATALITATQPPAPGFVVATPRPPASRLSAALGDRPRHARFMVVAPPATPALPVAAITALVTVLRDVDPATLLRPDQ